VAEYKNRKKGLARDTIFRGQTAGGHSGGLDQKVGSRWGEKFPNNAPPPIDDKNNDAQDGRSNEMKKEGET